MSQIGAAIEPAAIAGSTIPSIVEELLTPTAQRRTDSEVRPEVIRWAAGRPVRGRTKDNGKVEDRVRRQARWTAVRAIVVRVGQVAWRQGVATVVEIASVTAAFLQEVGPGEAG